MTTLRLNGADLRPATVVLIKLVGTAGVCGLIWWSLQNPDKGMLREVTAFGPTLAAMVALGFLACVLAYALDLVRVLQAIPDSHRVARPGTVWWMLVIPYNFTEDFFIIENIARSLENITRARPELAMAMGRFGRRSGLGWCALQILSLVPHDVGSVAGVLALPLWLWHWRFVRKARAALTQKA